MIFKFKEKKDTSGIIQKKVKGPKQERWDLWKKNGLYRIIKEQKGIEDGSRNYGVLIDTFFSVEDAKKFCQIHKWEIEQIQYK